MSACGNINTSLVLTSATCAVVPNRERKNKEVDGACCIQGSLPGGKQKNVLAEPLRLFLADLLQDSITALTQNVLLQSS